MLVDGVCDPFLTGASFANNQYRSDMARHPLHHGHKLAHDLAGHDELRTLDRVVGSRQRGHSIRAENRVIVFIWNRNLNPAPQCLHRVELSPRMSQRWLTSST